MNLNPSSKWKKTERVDVAVAIVRELSEKANTGFVLPRDLIDYSERIEFVLTKSAMYLESNRKHILEGQPFRSGSKEIDLG